MENGLTLPERTKISWLQLHVWGAGAESLCQILAVLQKIASYLIVWKNRIAFKNKQELF